MAGRTVDLKLDGLELITEDVSRAIARGLGTGYKLIRIARHPERMDRIVAMCSNPTGQARPQALYCTHWVGHSGEPTEVVLYSGQYDMPYRKAIADLEDRLGA